MNIGNITSNNFNLDNNGKDIQIEVYEQLIEQLQQENQELNQKYLNAVADYETTISELQELKKQLEELEEENFNLRENIYIEKMSFSSEGRNIKELIEMPTYEELQKENEKLHSYKTLYQSLKRQKEELRDWLVEQEEKSWDEVSSTFSYVLDKLEELEQGSDSNVKD